ncbi:glycosyltransferase [Pseudomonas lundensis]|uniref:glycosyltransferase n=1 Tax=Serratia proteamaculans TaxID=28151 RepID=UPI0029825FC1|nr:glycosyltransferase [Serratia proteamaculans]MDW5501046.1 glycosyltransferase [Serratia proteamaculans]MDW5506110.1 glycosyltransferase [Pseudomonas lundensis]
MNYTNIDADKITEDDVTTRLRISVVAFYINDDIFTLMDSVVRAQRVCPKINVEVIVVENGFKQKTDLHSFLEEQYPCCRVVISGENLGYGRAHNLTLSDESDFHLILNPDIILNEETLVTAMKFMADNPQCGLLTPLARWRNGERQFLCKRYPTVLTLLLRAFAPASIRNIFKFRLDHYNMTDVINEKDDYWNPQIVSGCFMLFRNNILLDLEGFDPQFFLYFEDTDLSFRAVNRTQVAYVPSVQIVHHGGNVSRKGIKHMVFFGHSMIKFFNKYGWKMR